MSSFAGSPFDWGCCIKKNATAPLCEPNIQVLPIYTLWFGASRHGNPNGVITQYLGFFSFTQHELFDENGRYFTVITPYLGFFPFTQSPTGETLLLSVNGYNPVSRVLPIYTNVTSTRKERIQMVL